MSGFEVILQRMAYYFLKGLKCELRRACNAHVGFIKVVSPVGGHIGYEVNGVLIRLEDDSDE